MNGEVGWAAEDRRPSQYGGEGKERWWIQPCFVVYQRIQVYRVKANKIALFFQFQVLWIFFPSVFLLVNSSNFLEFYWLWIFTFGSLVNYMQGLNSSFLFALRTVWWRDTNYQICSMQFSLHLWALYELISHLISLV